MIAQNVYTPGEHERAIMELSWTWGCKWHSYALHVNDKAQLNPWNVGKSKYVFTTRHPCAVNLLRINERLLKINSNGAARLSRAAVRALSGLLSRGCRRSFIVQHSVTVETWLLAPSVVSLLITVKYVKRVLRFSTTDTFTCSVFKLKKMSLFLKSCSPFLSLVSRLCQVDLLMPTKVTGIITQGAKDFGRVQFVGSYKVAYSNDGERWNIYQDEKQRKDKVRSSDST